MLLQQVGKLWTSVHNYVYFKAARSFGNKMLHQYHPGAFGKDEPGQWSCCKRRTKAAIACSDTSQQEAYTTDIILSEISTDAYGHYERISSLPVIKLTRDPSFEISSQANIISFQNHGNACVYDKCIRNY